MSDRAGPPSAGERLGLPDRRAGRGSPAASGEGPVTTRTDPSPEPRLRDGYPSQSAHLYPATPRRRVKPSATVTEWCLQGSGSDWWSPAHGSPVTEIGSGEFCPACTVQITIDGRCRCS